MRFKICQLYRSAPLKEKLYEIEKLYGKYSVHILCETLDVSRSIYYNHILRNKKQNNSYAEERAVLSKAISEIYEESHGLFGSDKIL